MRPVVSLYALPLVLMMAGPTAAFAQSQVCNPIRRGESATDVARRLTGDGRNAYRTWFQIKNPSSRFVPKSQYNRIRAGWQACVTRAAIQSSSSNVNRVAAVVPATPEIIEKPISSAIAAPAATSSVVVNDAVERILDLRMVWLGAAMVVPWFGWRILDHYLVRRKTTSIVMRHFAHRFVDEFERPLVRFHAAERPIRARLRYSTSRRRLEILLAPSEGRRYPNLSDHKKNVEYDVSRVMHAIADESFVSGRLYTRAGWVVVPFEFKSGPNRLRAFGASTRQEPAGVTCISSF